MSDAKLAIDWEALTEAARAARANAHAPYSGYPVGSALLTASGRVFAGCNVENASYGLCICAERSAIAQMVSVGERDLVAAVVVTRGPDPAAPCGMCRQTLAEFAIDIPIRLVAESPRAHVDVRLEELLPLAFRGSALGK